MSGVTAGGNRARRGLDAGQVVTVVAGHSAAADTIDLLGPAGFDGFWIEGEHGPFTWDRLGDQTRACDLWGMTSFVRLRALERSMVARALTLGAHGIVIPQVSTRAEAEALVDAAKFAPVGSRGVSRGRRSYGRADFLDTDNDETVLVVQVEDPAGLANLEGICAVEHLDVVFIAPNDLAQAMGLQGRPDHPDVVSAIDDGLARIAATGKAAGTNCALDQVERFVGVGARFLYVNYDAWLTDAARRYRGRVGDAVAGRTTGVGARGDT